ncbi:aldehyde dehydrogenase family protein [Nonomuraea sp. NPDC049480]|uniref:aldehyde dehydrogenase family protein n=1 Tax=Nonomuraea sp. NPDC049480 TaxID=3364353 RepID=UPI0037B24606
MSTFDEGTFMLINGSWRDGKDRLAVTAPADGSAVGEIPWGTPQDAADAADAAARAFPEWADRPARYRADLLRAAADRIDERADALARLLAAEAGKRLPEALAEIRFSAEYFRWFAEETRRPAGSVIPHEVPGRRHLTLRRPLGVVASLTPWNFPCSIQARKLAPALAAGCTVVARVSEKAPLAVTELIRFVQEAGLPPGVLNLVHGPAVETTNALLDHPAVRAVSFTGSTAVGAAIMARAARRIVRPLLELGGDAPFVVFPDADIDAAVDGAMIAKFRNTGQSCIAANRFYVHDDVYDSFVGRLVTKVDDMTVGDGLADPCPDLGPVIDDDRARAVRELVDDALAAGATLLTRPVELPSQGSYAAPALLAGVSDGVGLARCEVFGPAAAVFRFRDEGEVLDNCNRTELGLAAYIWSADVSRCWRMAERLEAGIVGVNNALPSAAYAPMGGIKQSGLGREGADLGLAEFTDVRYVALGL